MPAVSSKGRLSIYTPFLAWATDPETGETALKPVVQTFRNETTEWIHVTVNGETLICTLEHPFYVPQKGWTSAIDLRAGDRLQLLNGEYVVIEQVQHEILECPVTTYNFEVEGFHTYYVGEEPVLVHNQCQQRVAGTREGYNAKVSVGGELKHRPHAHIFWNNTKIASVDSLGNVTDGFLDKAGRDFVKQHLDEIAEGISKWWYYGK